MNMDFFFISLVGNTVNQKKKKNCSERITWLEEIHFLEQSKQQKQLQEKQSLSIINQQNVLFSLCLVGKKIVTINFRKFKFNHTKQVQ